MRIVFSLLTASLFLGTAQAQLQQLQVQFDDGGCTTCAESIQTRLSRVRGVEESELDLEKGVVRLRLAEDNRIRLLPLVSRIGQGGAKVLHVCLTARGAVEQTDSGTTFRTGGVGELFQLEGDLPPPAANVLLEAEAEAVNIEAKRLRTAPNCATR